MQSRSQVNDLSTHFFCQIFFILMLICNKFFPIILFFLLWAIILLKLYYCKLFQEPNIHFLLSFIPHQEPTIHFFTFIHFSSRTNHSFLLSFIFHQEPSIHSFYFHSFFKPDLILIFPFIFQTTIDFHPFIFRYFHIHLYFFHFTLSTCFERTVDSFK